MICNYKGGGRGGKALASSYPVTAEANAEEDAQMLPDGCLKVA